MKRVFLVAILGIIVLSFILPKYLFPSDILFYLPSFSVDHWQKPHNSLLADSVYQFEPWRHYAKEQLLHGSFPLWNEYNAGGAPLFANFQSAVAYPLNIFYYVLPAKNASWVIPLLKIFLFAFFTYLYLRVLNLSTQISFVGAFIASSSAFLLMWILWPHTNVFIFLPLILYITELIFQNKFKTRLIYIFLAIIYFCAISGGHPGTVVHITLIHLIYTVFKGWGKKNKIFSVLLSILCGFLLSSFLLFPFFEYLLNSSAFETRFFQKQGVVLPLKSIIFNFIPFLLGAPHQEFYKQINSIQNFQELTLGYIGPIVLILSFFGIYKFWKDRVVRVWSIIIFLSATIAYGVWPFWLITKLPILNGIANNRLMSFAGFGFIILFCITSEKILLTKKKITSKYTKYLLATIIIVLVGSQLIVELITKNLSDRIAEFYPWLSFFVIIQVISTIIFFLLFEYICSLKLVKRISFSLLLLLPLCMQTLFLFWNYNTVSETYYPNTKLVKKLQSLSPGKVLEVGNLNFPPNLNLIYNLQSAQNDDALEYSKYKTEFDKTFPVKNQWRRVENITLSSLQKFGIQYIISDFDLNLSRQILQGKYSQRLPDFESGSSLSVKFKASSTKLSQVRILTANHNRLNTCLVKLYIREVNTDTTQEIGRLDCRDVRDSMYYTIPVTTELNTGSSYIISFIAYNISKNNTIALLGNNNLPYIELLYDQSNTTYKKEWNEKSVYLWKVPDSHDINFPGIFKVVKNLRTEIVLEVYSNSSQQFEIKKVNYPGWNFFVDGIQAKQNENVFLKASIPAGTHIVSLRYTPLTFYIGIIFSFITGMILICIVLRDFSQRNQIKLRQIDSVWKKHVTIVEKRNSLLRQILIVVFSSVLGVFLYLILYFFILPKKISLPSTTVINWFVVKNHSLTLDYIRFISFVILILLSILVGWYFFIWKKNR